jgi:hypothetical protein
MYVKHGHSHGHHDEDRGLRDMEPDQDVMLIGKLCADMSEG